MELWEIADLATPWCVHVAATLRVADHIGAGKEHIEDLAQAAGADAGALGRVLRQLVHKGVFEEPAPGRFQLNDAARGLLGPERAGFDLEGFGGRMAHAWSSLLPAVRTGRSAYREVFGRDFWDDLAAHPEIAAQFDTLMGPGHGTPDPRVLIDQDSWASVKSVCDVGGGTGSLLAEVLRARPDVRGTLVDVQRATAQSAEVFAAAGVAGRAQAVAQSFFDPLPAGHDVYLLKSVLCDWDDDGARAILRRCAEAARPAGRVVVLNGLTATDRADPNLLMLILVSGRNRTLAEFSKLAADAGLRVEAAAPSGSYQLVVECRVI